MFRAVTRAGATLALLAATALPAHAQYSFVSSRPGIGGSGLLNWASVAAEGEELVNPAGGLAVSGTSLTATLSQPVGPTFLRVDQGSFWLGNFAPGASAVWNLGGGPSVSVMFSEPVRAAGASFQTNEYTASFTGLIQALDAMQNVLATFTFTGVSSDAGDGSAVFAGISSSLGDIYGVRFVGVSGAPNANDFAIDNVSVNVDSNVVPEPSTYALLATGLCGLGAVARRKRRV